jgi:SOS-response transcriptional repressor LexA
MADAKKPTLSQLLRKQYERLKETRDAVTLSEIAESVGFTQSYMTALHRGQADRAVAKWPGEKAYAFLLAHRFTTQEARLIAEQHNLDNLVTHLDFVAAGAWRGVKEGGPQVRYLGSVSAGAFGTSFATDDSELVDIPSHVLRHHDPADVFALDITGDSMVSEEARSSLPPGARAYFHRRQRPEPGKIVVARLERHDISVIKVYKPGTDFVTLWSLNREHRRIVIDAENPASLEGVLLGLSLAV